MANQAVYVDLDLKGNALLNVKAAADDTSAPNWGQVKNAVAAGVGIDFPVDDVKGTTDQIVVTEAADVFTVAISETYTTALKDYADDAVAVEAADRLAADEVLQSAIDAIPTIVAGSGLGSATAGDDQTISVGKGDGILVSDTLVSVDPTWLKGQIQAHSANNLLEGDGIEITPGETADDPDTVAVKVDANANNVLQNSPDGLYVPPTDLTAYYTKTQVDASQAAQNTAITNNATAISNEATARESADDALDARINALNTTVGAIDYPVEDVKGTTGQITVTENADVFTVAIDDAYTTARDGYADGKVAAEAALRLAGDEALDTKIDGVAGDLATEEAAREAADTLLQGNIDTVAGDLVDEVARATAAEGALQGEIDAEEEARIAADAALGTRISNLSITGAGMVTVTPAGVSTGAEEPAGTWVIDVPAIQLANTYVGADSDPNVGIPADTDIQPGDLYISTEGITFIATGAGVVGSGTNPTWTELSAAESAVATVAGTTGEILIDGVVDPQTGSVKVSLDPAITSAITLAKTTNDTQDGRLTALELIDHVPAVSGNGAITVDADTQAVGLKVVGPELSVDPATGLKIDLTSYAKGADLTALTGRVANNESDLVTIKGQQITQDGLIADNTAAIGTNAGKIADLETSQAAQDTKIATNDTAIKANATAINGLNTSQAAQDTKITDLEALHVSYPVDFGAGGGSKVIEGPAGRTVTVRDNGGCVVTLSVCETAAGQYTVASNLLFSGTITFG